MDKKNTWNKRKPKCGKMTVLIKNKFVFFLMMWIIFVSLCPAYSQAEKKGLALIKKGEDLLKKTNYEEALKKFREARVYLYTDTNRLRLYKYISRVYYALGKEKESVNYIMKVLEIKINARLRGDIAPRYRVLFLQIQKKLKQLNVRVKDLTDKKLFSEARKELEQAVEFKNHKEVKKLKHYIMEAERKYSEEHSK